VFDTIAIVFLGMAALMAKLSQGTALMLAGGFALLFVGDVVLGIFLGAVGGNWIGCSPGPGADGTPISEVLCVMVGWLNGTTGRALAIVGIRVVGIGALLAKVSWGVALLVAMGVALIFGASAVVTQLGGPGGLCGVGGFVFNPGGPF